MISRHAFITGAVAIATTASASAVVVIDDFSAGSLFTATAPNTVVGLDAPVAGVIGGAREVIVAGSVGVTLGGTSAAPVVGAASLLTGSSAGSVTFNYGSSITSAPFPELNLDLVALGQGSLFIDVASFNLSNGTPNPPIAAELTLTSGATTASLTDLIFFGDAGFNFGFADPAFAAIDFTDIDGFSVSFDLDNGENVEISEIVLIPEPSSALWLGALALAGLTSRRRR